ncbi:hypothetical protein GTS56_004533 [Salmonella enterica]|nr:hypothetical protein [Salmonella enterica]
MLCYVQVVEFFLSFILELSSQLFQQQSWQYLLSSAFSALIGYSKELCSEIEIQHSEQTRVQAEKCATQVVVLLLDGITPGDEPGEMALTVQMDGIGYMACRGELLISDHQLTVLIAFIFISQF